MAYQRRLARELRARTKESGPLEEAVILAEHWYEWGDEYKDYRLAQPDIICVLRTAPIIVTIECKLTAKLEAYYQLKHLYGPLALNEWPDYKHLHLIAAHNWRPCGPVVKPHDDLEEVLKEAKVSSSPPTYGWHYL